jgi:DNA modification methylase
MQTNVLLNQDCIPGMKSIAPGSVQLVIADPPYNIGAEGNHIESEKKKFSSIDAKWDNIEPEAFEVFTKDWLKAAYDILCPNGAILVWGTRHNIYICGYWMKKIGFDIRCHYTWHKQNAMPSLTGRGPSESSEQCIWAVKGPNWTYNLEYAKAVRTGNFRDVFFTTMTPSDEKTFGKHPSQKRLKGLTDHLVNLHSNPNDVVVIPFCGSGTECLAAATSGRRYIAFDLKKEYLEIASNRIKNSTLAEPVVGIPKVSWVFE